MPDIAMCNNVSCLLRHWCLRYRAIPDARQSWSEFKPKLAECDAMIHIVTDDPIVSVEAADKRNSG
jgi:hypothetical protein